MAKTPTGAAEQRPWWKRRGVVAGGVLALVVGAPLLSLDLQLFFLNLVGLGIGLLLLRQLMPRRPARKSRR